MKGAWGRGVQEKNDVAGDAKCILMAMLDSLSRTWVSCLRLKKTADDE